MADDLKVTRQEPAERGGISRYKSGLSKERKQRDKSVIRLPRQDLPRRLNLLKTPYISGISCVLCVFPAVLPTIYHFSRRARLAEICSYFSYVAPFDRCDREQDYETAWKFFEEKYGKEK